MRKNIKSRNTIYLRFGVSFLVLITILLGCHREDLKPSDSAIPEEKLVQKYLNRDEPDIHGSIVDFYYDNIVHLTVQKDKTGRANYSPRTWHDQYSYLGFLVAYFNDDVSKSVFSLVRATNYEVDGLDQKGYVTDPENGAKIHYAEVILPLKIGEIIKDKGIPIIDLEEKKNSAEKYALIKLLYSLKGSCFSAGNPLRNILKYALKAELSELTEKYGGETPKLISLGSGYYVYMNASYNSENNPKYIGDFLVFYKASEAPQDRRVEIKLKDSDLKDEDINFHLFYQKPVVIVMLASCEFNE